MGTQFNLQRTAWIYSNIWHTSPRYLVRTVGSAIVFTVFYLMFLSSGDAPRQFQALLTAVIFVQINALGLIRNTIYNNGVSFFLTPTRAEERLTAMILTLATTFLIAIMSSYVGFILWNLIDTNGVQSLQIEQALHPEIESQLLNCGGLYLLNPQVLLQGINRVSAETNAQLLGLFLTVPLFCYATLFLTTILTSNQWIMMSVLILLAIIAVIAPFNFITDNTQPKEPELWKTICYSPYFYALLTIGLIGFSFIKLKLKQVL